MKLSYVLFALFAIFLVLASSVIQGGVHRLRIDLEVEIEEGDEVWVNASYSIGSSSFSKSLNVLCFPISQWHSWPIHIFEDARVLDPYQSRSVHGLYDHLRTEMDLIGSNVSVSMVNLDGLMEIIDGEPSILILASRTLNETGYGASVLRWVERGGVLFSVGNESLPFLAKVSGGEWVGPDEFLRLRYHPLAFSGGEGMQPSTAASALSLENVAPIAGIDVEDVEAYGGTVIGYHYQRERDLASAALFRIGNGTLIAFAGPISAPFVTTAEDVIAADIARVVACGLQWISGPIFWQTESAGQNAIAGVLSATFESAEIVSVFAFTNDDFQAAHSIRIATVGGSP